MKRLVLLFCVMGSAVTAYAQLTVVRTERVPLEATRAWSQARFSPDGSRLYVTAPDYRGIWEFTFATRTTRQITDDAGAGYGFAVSPDGSMLAYRRTVAADGVRRAGQELVLRRLADGSSEIVASDRKVDLPAFAGDRIVYPRQSALEKPPAGAVTLLGIDETKIALLVDGSRRLLDPLGTGRYIWPALSPERSRVAAVQMERGALVCDLDGTVLAMLGRCNAPSWTFDGRWIVGMDDRDDGHRVTSSDLVVVAADGTRGGALTETPDVMEMFPDCSPVDRRIAFTTLDGAVFVLTYEEEGR